MNKENCALKLVDEIILYYDARSEKHQKITGTSLKAYGERMTTNCIEVHINLGSDDKAIEASRGSAAMIRSAENCAVRGTD